ncbi:MAG: acyltransferase [Sphingomonadaceae bacterium]
MLDGLGSSVDRHAIAGGQQTGSFAFLKTVNTDFMLHRLVHWINGRSGHRKGNGLVVNQSTRIINAQKNVDSITIGDNCIVFGELFVFGHGGKISIGDHCFIGENSRIWSGSGIVIGNRVLISHDVNIFDNDTHPFDLVDRHKHFLDIKHRGHPSDVDLSDMPVIVKDDAWISAKAIVLKGVTIGRGAVVGAGAVVTRDVPDFAIVAGNPAKTVRQLEPPKAS